MPPALSDSMEWLEADGLGGFASGSVSGVRTRRYHALLLAATQPPAERMVLVNGFDADIEIEGKTVALSSQRYVPDVVNPDGQERIISFTREPWPRWTFKISKTLSVIHEIFVPHGSAAVVLSWRLEGGASGQARLKVRPFFSGRDFHALHHENPAFDFQPEQDGETWRWRFYNGLPPVVAKSNGTYSHDPCWYRRFLYTEERARGLDCVEDLAAPGLFEFDVASKQAVLIFAADGFAPRVTRGRNAADSLYQELLTEETDRRAAFATPLHRAADAYLVRRGNGKTIIAGYPWFGDWGRDTFIALRGLCLVTGRLREARLILLEWSGQVAQGMLPNRFPDHGEPPEYNSVDASLWFIIAVAEFFDAARVSGPSELFDDGEKLWLAVEAILSGYRDGTRHGIRLDDDGLLACGEQGVQLTWMDAKVNGRVITPRVGKPIEVQALWLNALGIAAQRNPHWQPFFDKGLKSFRERFWNESRQCLYDVIDCFHERGTVDPSLRPNQIFAVGGLPRTLLEEGKAASVVEAVEKELWTPMGLRTLAPGENHYAPHYQGNVEQRDGAYHQGTVWPWLAGPFVEAWVRVRGNSPAARQEARSKFLEPLFRHLNEAGLGHVSEIADAEPPHTPRGCPFQAWSLGELLRLDRRVLKE